MVLLLRCSKMRNNKIFIHKIQKHISHYNETYNVNDDDDNNNDDDAGRKQN